MAYVLAWHSNKNELFRHVTESKRNLIFQAKTQAKINPIEWTQDSADVWLLNSCTVKNPAEDHFRNFVNAGLESDKKVVVSGCVPQGRPDAPYLRGLSVIGVQQIDRVVEVVEETLKGNSVRLFGQKKVSKVGPTGIYAGYWIFLLWDLSNSI